MRGYGRLPHAAFLRVCGARTRRRARAFLRDRLGDVTTGLGPPARAALNIAFTAPGLVAIGLPDDVVAGGFAAPFVEGMTTEHRRGCSGTSDRPRRSAGPGAVPDTPPVHLMVLLYAATAGDPRRAARRGARGRRARRRRGAAHGRAGAPRGVRVPWTACPSRGWPGCRAAPGGRTVRDRRVRARLPQCLRPARPAPLLDPATDPQRILPRDPGGTGAADLGIGGSYLVVRQLRQDVEAFTTFLRERTRRRRGARTGRRRSGWPRRWSAGGAAARRWCWPPTRTRRTPRIADFGYHAEDPHGLACPLGAHIRRANPRDALPPKPGSERSLRLTDHHRLLRRGRSYTVSRRQGTSAGCTSCAWSGTCRGSTSSSSTRGSTTRSSTACTTTRTRWSPRAERAAAPSSSRPCPCPGGTATCPSSSGSAAAPTSSCPAWPRCATWLSCLPSGRGEPMNTLQSWLATLAVAVDDRRRWDRWPTPLALALILGIRAACANTTSTTPTTTTSRPSSTPSRRPARSWPAPSTGPTTTCRPRRWAWPAPGSAATCRRGSPSPSRATG